MSDIQILENQRKEKAIVEGNTSLVKFLFSNGKNYNGFFYFQDKKYAIDFDFDFVDNFLNNFSIEKGNTLNEIIFGYDGDDDDFDNIYSENELKLKGNSIFDLLGNTDSTGLNWRIVPELQISNEVIIDAMKNLNQKIKGDK